MVGSMCRSRTSASPSSTTDGTATKCRAAGSGSRCSGRHRTTVAILPHGAGLYDVLRESEALDLPLRIGRGTAAPAAAPTSLVRVDHAGILVSAAKAADDGEGLVVRLHEAHGDRTTVSLGGSFTRAWRAALTEEREAELPVADGATALTLRPFELVTLRVV